MPYSDGQLYATGLFLMTVNYNIFMGTTYIANYENILAFLLTLYMDILIFKEHRTARHKKTASA